MIYAEITGLLLGIAILSYTIATPIALVIIWFCPSNK